MKPKQMTTDLSASGNQILFTTWQRIINLGIWNQPKRSKKLHIAEFCLRMGADPFIPKITFNHDKDKHIKLTPLDIAQKNGHTKLVVLLKQAEKGRFLGKVKSLFNKFNT
jgi:hypothetical protein